MVEEQDKQKDQNVDVLARIAEKVEKSENVLIALSKDPNVDELAAAIGLTMMLDGVGKHATAIFSGHVPNALEFLEPEKTLEKDTNSLQDFIIALNKEKADHLRYKIEGDYVKVFITPYKAMIDEKDLEFSHGDFNVDLVIAIDVASTNDLDAALYEHGRIMHNASSINIAAGMPGSFGDLEWGDPGASSVSEMICELEMRLRGKEGKTLLTQATATAFLTGIVAATDRFSNEKTTPNAMSLAGKLMESGADQQMISANIKAELGVSGGTAETVVEEKEDEKLKIEKKAEVVKPDETLLKVQQIGAVDFAAAELADGVGADSSEKELEKIIEASAIVSQPTGPLMNELKEVSTKNPALQATPMVAENSEQAAVVPINYSQGPMGEMPAIVAPVPGGMSAVAPVTLPNIEAEQSQMVVPPNAELVPPPLPLPDEGVLPPPPPPFDPNQQLTSDILPTMSGATDAVQPVNDFTPVPEVQMASTPVSMENVAPAVDAQTPVMPQVVPITPAAPVEEPARTYLGENPAMQDQVYPQGPQQQNDPGAFMIPGA